MHDGSDPAMVFSTLGGDDLCDSDRSLEARMGRKWEPVGCGSSKARSASHPLGWRARLQGCAAAMGLWAGTMTALGQQPPELAAPLVPPSAATRPAPTTPATTPATIPLDEAGIQRAIADLGSSLYDERDAATGRLSQLTADSLPTLEMALKQTTDPEVQVRLSSVIAKLKHERQQRIVRQFLRDPDMTNDHELRGWSGFARVAGANRSSKRLFLQLSDRYPSLVEEPLEPGQSALESARRVARGIQEDQLQRGEGDKTDGLALLYCLCAAEDEADGTLSSLSVRTFLRAPYNQFLRDPQAKKPMEMMTERWGLSLTNPSDQTAAILILLESDLNTARSVARKLLARRDGPDQAEPEEVLIALQVLFRFGKAEDLPMLERWLDDTDVCEETVSFNFPGAPVPGGLPRIPAEPAPAGGDPGRTIYTVEVRDAAVLACMQISAMDYRKHFPSIVMHELRGYLPRTIAGPKSSDAAREARIEAWRNTVSAAANRPVPPQ
jgi:hypothetical protein